MQLKSAIKQLDLLCYMVEALELYSGVARRVLWESPWLKDAQALVAQTALLHKYYAAQTNADIRIVLSRELLQIKLAGIRDIRGSLLRLQDGGTPDDVEWFEIKSFVLLSQEIRDLLPACGMADLRLPSLENLIRLLDPEGHRIPSFYIYDAYSIELAELRKQLGSKMEEMDAQGRLELFEKMSRVEARIREMLAEKARPYVADSLDALQQIALIDIGFAKAKQMVQWGLVIPKIAEINGLTAYKGLFHPQIATRLAEEGRAFQPIDIAFGPSPTLITGSNMGGKTVVLNMIATAQCLFQFGFAVPAHDALVAPVDGVALSLLRKNEAHRGLSSYASEVVHIDGIIKDIRKGRRLLAIFDEPAQTTNPTEGVALVSALLALLAQKQVRAVLTTHYSGISGPFSRLRVRGFSEEALTESLTAQNIEKYMNYSLVKASEDAQAPKEALRVARLLEVDAEWLALSQAQLEPDNSKIP